VLKVDCQPLPIAEEGSSPFGITLVYLTPSASRRATNSGRSLFISLKLIFNIFDLLINDIRKKDWSLSTFFGLDFAKEEDFLWKGSNLGHLMVERNELIRRAFIGSEDVPIDIEPRSSAFSPIKFF
jgi:hypothetical protein